MRFAEDYKKGGFPVLPVAHGTQQTIYQIGLYTFAYVAVAWASPMFVPAHLVYLIGVLPLGLKLLYEFYRFYQSGGTSRWLSFFLWVNASILVFLYAPVFDKWSFLLLG